MWEGSVSLGACLRDGGRCYVLLLVVLSCCVAAGALGALGASGAPGLSGWGPGAAGAVEGLAVALGGATEGANTCGGAVVAALRGLASRGSW